MDTFGDSIVGADAGKVLPAGPHQPMPPSVFAPAPAGTGISPNARTMTRIVERNLSDSEMQLLADVRAASYTLTLVLNRGSGREINIAKQKVEEALLWATKGITS